MVRLPIEIEPHQLPRDELLALAFYAPADAEALCELDRDPEHRLRFVLPLDVQPSVEHSLAVIDSWTRARLEGERFAFAVRRHAPEPERGELVGGVEIWARTLRCANLAYWIHPPHRRRGFARRAVALACRWIGSHSTLERVEIRVEPDNIPSHRVALGSGFRRVGVRAGHMLYQLQLERGARPPRE